MADQKISQLNELTSPLSGDTLPIVNNNETKKITVSNLLSGSNVQPYFISTDTGSAQNYRVGDNVWLGDIGMSDTLLIKGVNDSGSAFIKFGDAPNHTHPHIGHDHNEDANVFVIVADTTKISDAVIIGSGSLVAGNPEMIHVYSSGSFNIANFIGNTDTYSQINVKNLNNTAGSSSDIVVTANNGNEENHYVNLGINSSGWEFQTSSIGFQNDGYLYNVGQDMYVGVMEPASPDHGHLHLFSEGLWENSSINIVESGSVAFGTGSVTSGFTFEFSGSVKLQNDLQVNGYIQSEGSVYLQPDFQDNRNIQIYNTDTTDIHIKGNATYSFFGDDSNYVKIDNSLEKITINTNSGTTINGLFKLSPVSELPTSSTLGDMVVSGSNLYFHNGTSWNSINMTSI